jgi:hypothetical protein
MTKNCNSQTLTRCLPPLPGGRHTAQIEHKVWKVDLSTVHLTPFAYPRSEFTMERYGSYGLPLTKDQDRPQMRWLSPRVWVVRSPGALLFRGDGRITDRVR